MRYCPRTLQDFVQSHSPFSPAKDALGEFGMRFSSRSVMRELADFVADFFFAIFLYFYF